MAKTLEQLLREQEELNRTIHQLQAKQKADAIEQVRALMAENGLTMADIVVAKAKNSSRAGTTVAAKYRDAKTGQTWSGRGLKPKWLSTALANGKALEDFAV